MHTNSRRRATLLMMLAVMMMGLQGCNFTGLANFMRALFGQASLPPSPPPPPNPSGGTTTTTTQQTGTTDTGAGLGTSTGTGATTGATADQLRAQVRVQNARLDGVLGAESELRAWLTALSGQAAAAEAKLKAKKLKAGNYAKRIADLHKQIDDQAKGTAFDGMMTARSQLNEALTASNVKAGDSNPQQVAASMSQKLTPATATIDRIMRAYYGTTEQPRWPGNCASVPEPKDEPARTTTLVKEVRESCVARDNTPGYSGILGGVVTLAAEIRTALK